MNPRGEVRLWSTRTSKCKKVFREESDAVFCVVFAQGGRELIGSTADGKILAWDMETFELKQTLKAHDGLVNKIVLSNDAVLIASASLDGTVKIWSSTA